MNAKSNEIPFEVDQHITAHSNYYAGKMGSRFYAALRDRSEILGIRCEKCAKVLWPPRETCTQCFSLLSTDALVPVGPGGEVVTWTQVHYSEPVQPPVNGPLIYAVIKLDGADYGMTHLLSGVEPGKVRTGMRVKPVFAQEKKGNILDITCFVPE